MDTASLAETSVEFNDTLASWNRQRSSEELQSFIAAHHDSRLDDIVLE